jgi:tetratricopeptide (TPR) repeat protein
VIKDRYGNDLSTNSQTAADHYINAVDRFLAADSGVDALFQHAINEDENFALAHLALARSHQMRGNREQIGPSLQKARDAATDVTPREGAQINAIGRLLEGQAGPAYELIRAHLMEYPRDVMMAQTCMGVFGLIGFSGLPGRESEQLAFTTSLAPHYHGDWWFLSQHAFAQIEAGQTARAEAVIEKSLNINPRSAQGAHIRAHLYYENGEPATGFEYLADWQQEYPRDGLLHCHIAWHVALWALELNDEKTMRQIVDTAIKPGAGVSPPLNVMTDTTAILFRAALAGVDVAPKQWQEVSNFAVANFPEPGLAFADVHAALAHAQAGNHDAVAKIIAEARGPAGDLVSTIARGFQAMATGDCADANNHLSSAMADHARIGGSRAQRDLIELALTSVLLQLGHKDQAQAIITMHRPTTTPQNAVKGLYD